MLCDILLTTIDEKLGDLFSDEEELCVTLVVDLHFKLAIFDDDESCQKALDTMCRAIVKAGHFVAMQLSFFAATIELAHNRILFCAWYSNIRQ